MLTVGQTAPGFTLPSGQGPDVALADYRGRKNVLVWVTKGMACVFCRQHMSQLARALPELERRNTEVLEITPSTPQRARFYAQKYRLPFPYLCDADDAVRWQWGIGVRRHGPVWYVTGLMKALRTPHPENDFSQDPPALSEMGRTLRDDDMGVFIVDREGIVRYAYGGSYILPDDAVELTRPLPDTGEVLRALEACAA